MSDPILISDGEDENTPPFKRARKNPNPTILNLDIDSTTQNQSPGSASTPVLVDDAPLSATANVTGVKRSFGSGSKVSSRRENKFSGKRVISLESDSEDSHLPGTSNKYADSLKQPCLLESGSSDEDSDNSTNWMQGPSFRFLRSKDAIEVNSDQEKEVRSIEKMGRQKQNISSSTASLSVNALPKKQLSKDKKICVTEEKKLRKEQEKLQKAASKAEDAEQKRLEREKKKWEKEKALKAIVTKIDVKLAEAKIGGQLILGFNEKGITYKIVSNPIEKSIVWTMTLPEDIAQTLPLGSTIPYVLLVFEAEDFCNLVAAKELLETVSRVRDIYPSYKVCYLTNKLMSYVNKKQRVEYKDLGNHSGWKAPPIEEALAKLTTHYIGVHSRHCLDEAEVAEHVVGLTSNLAYCQVRKKLTRLSVNADGTLMSKSAADKHLIRDSIWLKVLVTIPKVQPRQAVAVSKKYPTLKSLLKVYMDPNIPDHEKELLLEDLKVENIRGDTRLGEACSKRIYRVFMSTSGTMKTDDVEHGAASFTSPL